jgi:hypothetical protein
VQRVDGEDPRHQGAAPDGTGESPQGDEEEDGRGRVKEHIGEQEGGGIRAVQSEAELQRDPIQRQPIAVARFGLVEVREQVGEGGGPGELRVVDDQAQVVVVDELVVDDGRVGGEGQCEEAETDGVLELPIGIATRHDRRIREEESRSNQ